MGQFAIGVDVGGTKIAFALVDEQGTIVAQHRLPTQPEEGTEAVIGRIRAGIQHLLSQAAQPVSGAGIAFPGHVDPEQGIVRHAVNLYWQDIPLWETLTAHFSLPIYVDNDVRVWAAGEMFTGAAQGVRNFVFLAIGTGLGGSAVMNGKLVYGSHQFAMEVGHLPVGVQGRRCTCGLLDCAEMYLSGKGILASVAAYRRGYPDSVLISLPEITTQAVLSAAGQGDTLALVVLQEARQTLETIVVWCAGLLNPELIVIGGGMGQAARTFLMDGLESAVKSRLLPPVATHLRIVPSAITEATVGAASLVWMHQAQQHS